MADIGSTGLWVKFDERDDTFRHGAALPEDVGISAELADRLDSWCEEYANSGDEETSVNILDAAGRHLARDVKRELGSSVQVVYAPISYPREDEPIS